MSIRKEKASARQSTKPHPLPDVSPQLSPALPTQRARKGRGLIAKHHGDECSDG